MKLIYTILLLIWFNANATIYYVDNGRPDDTGNGTSEATAWKTIAKVNASSFLPGDQILFKRGGIWNERLNPPSSGSAGNVIRFDAYGTGAKPIITGFQALTGFVNTGGNIWTATASNAVSDLNTVGINGVLAVKGRYPNSTYLLSSANAANNQTRVITSFTGTPDYTGGELVTTGYSWIIDVNKIASQNTDTINLATPTTYNVDNYSYFVQNLPSLCDVQNDYAYNSTTKLLSIYSVSEPLNVQISTIDTIVFMNHKSYIIFDGLALTGANKIAVDIDTSGYITIQNCKFENHGRTGIYGQMSTYANIKNDSLTNIQSNAIFIVRGCDYDSVTNNYIKNIGLKQGMGESGNGTYLAMFVQGASSIITKNRVDSIGYCGIQWNGINSLIQNNYITNYLAAKNDGGGIYTAAGGTTNSIVKSNICINGIMELSPGIYMDYSSDYVTIDSNTVSRGKTGVLLFNSPNNITVKNNTFINDIGAAYYYSTGGGNTFNIKNNIFYSTDSTQVTYYSPYGTGAGSLGNYVSDSNYFMRPVKEADKVKILNTFYTLAGYSAATGYDTHSYSTPTGITSAEGILYTNPTLSDSAISLSGRYIDARGMTYNGSATIAPFQSKILFYATDQSRYSFRIGNLKFK